MRPKVISKGISPVHVGMELSSMIRASIRWHGTQFYIQACYSFRWWGVGIRVRLMIDRRRTVASGCYDAVTDRPRGHQMELQY